MKIENIHRREFPVSAEVLGELLDSLSSQQDCLWPTRYWQPMRFDRPLSVGAHGGHAPLVYDVASYEQGRAIDFEFQVPKGFDGGHSLEIVSKGPQSAELIHRVDMRTSAKAWLQWTLFFGPLHDALLEDAFVQAEHSLGLPEQDEAWSAWVKFLRWVATAGKAPKKVAPEPLAATA